MLEFWTSITGPQATIISGVLTFLAAIAGVVLGWGLLSGQVTSLSVAVGKMRKVLDDHKEKVDRTLADASRQFDTMSERIQIIGEELAALQQAFGQIRGELVAVADDVTGIAEEVVNSDPDEDAPGQPEVVDAKDTRESFRDDWSTVRDSLEAYAAVPSIDGRTRARYNRIDRRNYHDLIDALDANSNLPNANAFREAVDIWYAHRTGRAPITPEHAAKLSELARRLGPPREV